MIDTDISSLAEQPADRSLDHLEADIWAGIAAQTVARRTGRIVASCQAGVMIVALVGAAAAGASTATFDHTSSSTIITSAGADFAPSTLLLGKRP
ncbi:MAG: hypothetical protein KGJ78_17965 [Alphaproteobacteria bacterium]|nr:hypothetical protein [Alphaproteobacteria bacterium]